MNRIQEMVSGKVAVIGKKSVLKNIFYHIINHCRTLTKNKVKTFVLDVSPYSFMANSDEHIRMGVYLQNNETLPDFLEPFLKSPSVGAKLENIVSAMSDVFFAGLSGKDTNDQYFIGTAEILFSELIRYSLMAMKRGDSQNLSLSSFAHYYTKISGEFPAMIDHSDRMPGGKVPYSYADEDLQSFEREGKTPFANSLINSASSTANGVEGTLRTHTSKMREFMALVASVSSLRWSFLKNVQQPNTDGIVFLQPAISLQTYPKLLFMFISECMRLLAEIYPQTEFKFIIPDIAQWKDPITLSSLLEKAPTNLSVIWGVSAMGMVEQLAKSHDDLGTSLLSMSDTQVWGRSGDAKAHNIYKELIPDTLRTYRLSQMPEHLCFVKSDIADFDAVAIPVMPNIQNFQPVQTGGAINSPLWADDDGGEPRFIENKENSHQKNKRGNNNDRTKTEHTNHFDHEPVFDIADLTKIPEIREHRREQYRSGRREPNGFGRKEPSGSKKF